jgi:uncharacterized protein
LSRLICTTIGECFSAGFRAALVAWLMVAVLAGAGVAGPYEDSIAAARRGDNAEALRLRRKAAEQGHAEAQYWLGIMYHGGIEGVPQDLVQAVRWYRKAAEQGHAAAQYVLNTVYRYGGFGVPQDWAEALKWCLKAAEQGHALALRDLGTYYYYGEGVPQDYAEGLKWLRKAARQGQSGAQWLLGVTYQDGIKGVPQNCVLAYMWYNLAGSSSGVFVPRNNIAAKMTSAQIAEGQRMSERCLRSNYTDCELLARKMHRH